MQHVTAFSRPQTILAAPAIARKPKENLRIACDALVPFAHWITPVGPPKRFDTHFFLAPAPSDQVAAHDGREAVETIWIAPQKAIVESEARRVTLVFATRMNLAKLEMRALFTALARRVKRFHIDAEERALHNILRGFSKLIVSVN